MEFITGLYFVYTFLAFYFLWIYILTYAQNKHELYETHKPSRVYPVSIVVPCFNVEKTIHKTVEALLAQDYPGLKKIVLVDDCSKDNTFAVLKSFQKKIPFKGPCGTNSKKYGKSSRSKKLRGKIRNDGIYRL